MELRESGFKLSRIWNNNYQQGFDLLTIDNSYRIEHLSDSSGHQTVAMEKLQVTGEYYVPWWSKRTDPMDENLIEHVGNMMIFHRVPKLLF